MLESEILPNPRRFLKAVCSLLVNESNMPDKLIHSHKHGKPKHWRRRVTEKDCPAAVHKQETT